MMCCRESQTKTDPSGVLCVTVGLAERDDEDEEREEARARTSTARSESGSVAIQQLKGHTVGPAKPQLHRQTHRSKHKGAIVLTTSGKYRREF